MREDAYFCEVTHRWIGLERISQEKLSQEQGPSPLRIATGVGERARGLEFQSSVIGQSRIRFCACEKFESE